MVFLESIQIDNYKNLESIHLKLEKKFICFTGKNGTGKTNLMDSIHYTSLGKSYFSSNELQNIRFDQDFFHLKSIFHRKNEIFDISCGLIRGDKKVIRRNGESYSRFSEHVGEFPVVMITPYDIELIQNGSEERRRFLDILISQVNKNYLETLVIYVRILKQRNAHLKSLAMNRKPDKSLIEIYNDQLCEAAKPLFETRKEFISQFREMFRKYYAIISNSSESVNLEYISQLNENDLKTLLVKNLHEDIRLERTGYGLHKDDLELTIDNRPVKKFGSQGQQKSFILALKLAEYEFIKIKKGYAPLLLLDDIFDKLDSQRIRRMIETISGNDFGQTFITDTDETRVRNFFSPFSNELEMYRIEKGRII